MNLIKNVDICPELSSVEKEMILAKNGITIKQISDNDIKNHLNLLINKTHLECGYEFNTITFKLTMPELVKDLREYFGTLTLNQITHAFKLGIMGDFGEWFGLSNKTYLGWVKGYLGSQSRLEANKKQNEWLKKKNDPKPMTEEEKNKIMLEASLAAFETFKSTGGYTDYGNSIYSFLDRKGLIPFTNERKKAIMEEAKNIIINEKKVELTAISSLQVAREIKKQLAELESGSKNDELIIKSKRIALRHFFKDLIETDTELKELLLSAK